MADYTALSWKRVACTRLASSFGLPKFNSRAWSFLVRRVKIRPHGHEMDVRNSRHGFELDHDGVCDQEVEPVQTDLRTPIVDGHRDLSLKGDLTVAQLQAQRVLVEVFEQTGSYCLVNLDRSTDNVAGQFFVRQHARLPPGFLGSRVNHPAPNVRHILEAARVHPQAKTCLTRSTVSSTRGDSRE